MPARRWRSLSSARTCLRSCGSSAERGSSSRSTSGCQDQGAGERDALALASGELRGHARCFAGQADLFKHGSNARVDSVEALAAQAEFDVAAHGEMGKKRVVLEDGIDVAAIGRKSVDAGTVEIDFAFIGRFESGDHPQRSGLSAAGRSEQREEGSARDFERYVRHRAVRRKALGQLTEFQYITHFGDVHFV